MYGDYYSRAKLLLVLISAGQFVNTWSGSGMVTLMQTGNQRAVMYISVVFGTLILAGSVFAVKWSGVSGVALVAGMGIAMQALFVLFWVRRKTGMWTYGDPRYFSVVWGRLNAMRRSV